MLIDCPECGKEISDKSDKCIHCGYPIKKDTKCIVNGKEYDLSFLLDDSYSIACKIRDLRQISGSDITHTTPIVKKIIESGEIPDTINLPKQNKTEDDNVLKCPTCSSTNIKKVSGTSKAVSVAMFGLLSQKVKKKFHCNNCGYEW